MYHPSSTRPTGILKALPQDELTPTTPVWTSEQQEQRVVAQAPSGSSGIADYYKCDYAEIRLPESGLSQDEHKKRGLFNPWESDTDVAERLGLLLNPAKEPPRTSVQIRRLPSWVCEDVRREFQGLNPKGKRSEGKENCVPSHREADRKSAVLGARSTQPQEPRQSAAFWRNAKRALLTGLVAMLLCAAIYLDISYEGNYDTDTSPRGDGLDVQEHAQRSFPGPIGALDDNNLTESGTALWPRSEGTKAGEDLERLDGGGRPSSHTVEADLDDRSR